jgi:protein TonB
MAPSSDWVVDYAEHSCALRRAFRAGEDQVILEFRLYGPGDWMEVVVVSDTVPRTRRAPRVRFEPDHAWHEPTSPLFVDAAPRHGVIYSDSLRPSALKPSDGAWPPWPDQDRDAREQAVVALTVADSFERDLTLETGRMHRPMQALRTCVQDLVSQWGLASVAPGTLARGPVPKELADWVRRAMANYPSDMVRAGKSGRVNVRLIVGRNGKPTACHPNGYAEPAFFEAACSSLMRYARFEPALDGSGEPAVGSWVTTIVYQLH